MGNGVTASTREIGYCDATGKSMQADFTCVCPRNFEKWHKVKR